MAVSYKMSEHRDIISLFTDLGEKIRIQWAKHNYNEDALVETAIDKLDEARLHQSLSADNLIHYALNPDPLQSAHQIDPPFGDLQQIMYRHARFYIEALYWCDGTTAVHDHGFSGAFYVMTGSSINLEYQFQDAERINHHFWLGKLSKPLVSKLQVGSIKPIYSGKRFIHSVFHLDNPTVSIVVRTYQDDDAMPQFEYRGKNIRLVEEFSPEFAKKIKGLRFLLSLNQEKFSYHFKHMYLESPLDERYWLLRAFYANFKQFPSIQQFLKEMDDVQTNILMKSITQEAIIHKTMQFRNNIEDVELRYFLAVLLNLPSWSDVVQFIQNDYPNETNTVIERALSNIKSHGLKIPEMTNHTLIHDYNNEEPITSNNVLYHLICRKVLANT